MLPRSFSLSRAMSVVVSTLCYACAHVLAKLAQSVCASMDHFGIITELIERLVTPYLHCWLALPEQNREVDTRRYSLLVSTGGVSSRWKASDREIEIHQSPSRMVFAVRSLLR
jgi:hypothetical protein